MPSFAMLRRPLVCLPLGCFALGMGVLAALPQTAPQPAEPVWQLTESAQLVESR